MMVDLGYGFSYFTPVSDGFPILYASLWGDFAGKDITDYMKTLIKD